MAVTAVLAACAPAVSGAGVALGPAAPGTSGGSAPAPSGPASPGTSAAASPGLTPAPSPSGAPVPTDTAVATGPGSCVARTLAGLSGTERAAQLLLVGVTAGRPLAGGPALVRLGVAGVFLRGRTAGTSSLRQQIASLQVRARRAGVPALFVAADQEGGAVQTVGGGALPPFPSARVQGTWSTGTLKARTTTWARELRRLGVNLDLAPVADVVPASIGVRNPPIGRYGRQYGSTPAAVSPRVAAVTAALKGARVGATVKHFPGLGRVLVNTDTGTGATDRATTATDPSLRPFSAGLRAGAVAVMVSSAAYPRLDRRRLAMWSPAIVTGLLRGRLGWKGLVLSDDLGQAVAARSVPVGRRATDFVAAGGDLVLTVVPSQAATMRSAIAARAARDRVFRARVADAVTHVLAAKQTLGLLRCR